MIQITPEVVQTYSLENGTLKAIHRKDPATRYDIFYKCEPMSSEEVAELLDDDYKKMRMVDQLPD